MNEILRVLNLGAGVQSTTVALLSKHGELPRLDCGIFADTGWEPKAVYDHLDWLEKQLPFPVYRVSVGWRIQEMPYRNADVSKQFVSLPMFTRSAHTKGRRKKGKLWRQCTKEFKIEPIRAKVRELCGLSYRQRAGKAVRVNQWFGISLDEITRMRDSDVLWIRHVYPLVFMVPMTRHDCTQWLLRHGYPSAPRSACIGCPLHSDAEWRALKSDSPEEFQQAVEFEARLDRGRHLTQIRQRAYLHRSLIPLNQVDFSTAEERGQQNWINECEGICGV